MNSLPQNDSTRKLPTFTDAQIRAFLKSLYQSDVQDYEIAYLASKWSMPFSWYDLVNECQRLAYIQNIKQGSVWSLTDAGRAFVEVLTGGAK